ncbi:MAG: DUF362 domain-containing protein [Candidatus Magnetobacterium sp. LHC-1]|uniref:DUF362 domain-containing protein n=1 Tax=Candidatus Magnetobacterium casense TaxID=1455061 RepID=A0ABS6S4G1_9BACT|nr:DUF362 domain-containing protein [Candidatus Magnetobacterium casensis]MBF0608771.1 DUF362 domain-containing protein [Nitrospirota bacterium]MBV6343253.1 DUF362 domain-containing protein [Candidatus Magnetobacterium casensis]
MCKAIVRESSYESKRLIRDVSDMLAILDTGIISPGKVVLIKPNLLRAATVQQAITTHPLIVRAVVEYVLQKRARPLVMDSPGVGNFNRIIRQTGLADALSGLDVTIAEFTDSVRVNSTPKGRAVDAMPIKVTELAREALEADCIINLPKLKTHVQMGMTLAVKNLFGCVVGLRKPQWHLTTGQRVDQFAQLLLSIYVMLRPSINILDGILAMEGDGPGTGGRPRQLGVLMGSPDALAIDATVCQMLGVTTDWLSTNKVARDLGMLKDVTIDGTLTKVRDFVMPGTTTSLVFGPSLTRNVVRQNLTSRPASSKKLCKLCNECVNICPAKAITNDGKSLHFDYEKCIRCYCCSEACPHGAIEVQRPLLSRLLSRLTKSKG